jgi:hypothetical protein
MLEEAKGNTGILLPDAAALPDITPAATSAG